VEEKEREEKGRGGSRRGEEKHRANAQDSPAVIVHPRPAHAIVVRPSKVSRHVNVTSGNDLLAMTSGRMTSGRMTSGRVVEYECELAMPC
jgi:hypothetical protein